jgi:hypothetical protein
MKLSRFIDFLRSTTLQNYKGEKIIMLHHGRCGSTVLTNMFEEYSEIEWHGEAYKKPFRKELQNNKESLLNSVKSRRVKRTSKKFGFEIKPMHLGDFSISVKEFIDFCVAENFSHYITLIRKNSLRKIVSSEIGRATQKWHLKPDVEIKKSKIYLSTNPKEDNFLINRLDDLQSKIQEITSIDPNTLKLVYEDDVRDDPNIGFKKLQQFLSLPEKQLTPSLKRFNPEPLSDLIENYRNVEKLLYNTPYEWMLND